MEEHTESPTDDDSVDEFINVHCLEVEDVDCRISKNKEMLTRWQEEKAFVRQLENDMMLREALDTVAHDRERSSDANMWFSSGMKTTNRAFNNQLDMVCDLDREAKRATELSHGDPVWDHAETELESMLTMTRIFQDEEGDFKFLHNRTPSQLLEFMEWRAVSGDEAAAAPKQVCEVEVQSLQDVPRPSAEHTASEDAKPSAEPRPVASCRGDEVKPVASPSQSFPSVAVAQLPPAQSSSSTAPPVSSHGRISKTEELETVPDPLFLSPSASKTASELPSPGAKVLPAPHTAKGEGPSPVK